MSKKSVKIPNG